MKRVVSVLVLLIVAVAIVLLGSCGKAELSRGDAQKAIETRIREKLTPATGSLEVGKYSLGKKDGTIDTVNGGMFKKFRDSGYVTVKVTGETVSQDILFTNYQAAPTEKLRPFVVKTEGSRLTVNIGGDVGKVNVTGLIKQEPNRTAAEFTYETRFNEVGQKLFGKPAVQESRGAALFVKYDDGWRLSDISTNQSGF